jgi:hypothetical protein
MIKLGDKVRFVNENLEGFVTSIQGKGLLGVTVDSDFEIPVQSSQVVKIDFQEKAGNNEPVKANPQLRPVSSNPIGIFIAFERINDQLVQAYFHNNFSEQVILVIHEKIEGVYHFVQDLKLDRDETKLFKKLDMEQFSNWPALSISILPIEFHTIKLSMPIVKELKFHAKTFHQTLKFSFFLQKQAYQWRMDEQEMPLDLKALKAHDFSSKATTLAPNLKDRPSELIDLHYDQLLQKGFSPSNDIVGLQMEVFTSSVEAAYINKMQKIVFIHGIGNLYLKNKIHTWLTKHKEMVQAFQLADTIQYGAGATEVILKN